MKSVNRTSLGGLGIRHIADMNVALLAKIGWEVAQGNSHWAQLLRSKYLMQDEDFLLSSPPRGSAIWNSVTSSLPLLRTGTKWRLGNGRSIDFWSDWWIGDKPLSLNPIWEPIKRNLINRH
ncbi:hypothetical protein KI387_006531, partial [Taxus chinensis]